MKYYFYNLQNLDESTLIQMVTEEVSKILKNKICSIYGLSFDTQLE